MLESSAPDHVCVSRALSRAGDHMQTRWKWIGATCLTIAVAIIVGSSHRVAGQSADTAASGATSPGGPSRGYHDPSQPWSFGSGAIPYSQQTPEQQADTDTINSNVAANMPPSSQQAWADAAAWSAQNAQAQIAASGVGLSGTSDQGVVP